MIYLNLSPLSDNTKIHTHSNFFTWHSVPYSTYIHHNHSSETASSNMTNKFNCCCLNYLLIPNFTSSLHNTCQSNIPFFDIPVVSSTSHKISPVSQAPHCQDTPNVNDLWHSITSLAIQSLEETSHLQGHIHKSNSSISF